MARLSLGMFGCAAKGKWLTPSGRPDRSPIREIPTKTEGTAKCHCRKSVNDPLELRRLVARIQFSYLDDDGEKKLTGKAGTLR